MKLSNEERRECRRVARRLVSAHGDDVNGLLIGLRDEVGAACYSAHGKTLFALDPLTVLMVLLTVARLIYVYWQWRKANRDTPADDAEETPEEAAALNASI